MASFLTYRRGEVLPVGQIPSRPLLARVLKEMFLKQIAHVHNGWNILRSSRSLECWCPTLPGTESAWKHWIPLLLVVRAHLDWLEQIAAIISTRSPRWSWTPERRRLRQGSSRPAKLAESVHLMGEHRCSSTKWPWHYHISNVCSILEGTSRLKLHRWETWWSCLPPMRRRIKYVRRDAKLAWALMTSQTWLNVIFLHDERKSRLTLKWDTFLEGI